MASLKVVVRHGRINKKNECKVELAICHFGVTCYIDLHLFVSCRMVQEKPVPNFQNGYCTKQEKDWHNKNLEITKKLEVYSKRLSKISNVEELTSKQIKTIIEQSDGQVMTGGVLTVEKAFQQYIKELDDEGRTSSANNIRNTLSRLKQFLPAAIALEDLRPSFVLEWQKWLRTQHGLSWHGKKLGFVEKETYITEESIGKYIAYFKAVVNRFVKCGAVRYDVFPFSSVRIKHTKPKICDLTIEQLAKLHNSAPIGKVEEVGKDVFFISFFMCGMNAVDICNAKWNDDHITYQRQKIANRSIQRQTLPVLPCVRTIINKYIQEDGTLNFGYPAANINNRANVALKRIAKREGVVVADGCICMTSARKTWAQIAGIIGVSDRVCNYCMGHVPGTDILSHYQRALAIQAEAACKAVVDFVDNPEQWKTILDYRAKLAMQMQ